MVYACNRKGTNMATHINRLKREADTTVGLAADDADVFVLHHNRKLILAS